MPNLRDLRSEIKKSGSPARAAVSRRFFKTGKGEYAEGDIFVGLTVPQCRLLVKKYEKLSISDIKILLQSKVHEERLIALLLLVRQYTYGTERDRTKIYRLYLSSLAYVNNWDLVDSSADKIVGVYLFDKPTDVLKKLAVSKNIWKRRVAMIATFAFIRVGRFEETFAIAELLQKDSHDLIHKAVGWMLREVGEKSIEAEKRFLQAHYRTMPRTMLRYAIEHFDEVERKKYLAGTI